MLEYVRYVVLGIAVANLIFGGIVFVFVIGHLLPFSIFVEGKVKPATEERWRNIGYMFGVGCITFLLLELTIICAPLLVVMGAVELFQAVSRRTHRYVC